MNKLKFIFFVFLPLLAFAAFSTAFRTPKSTPSYSFQKISASSAVYAQERTLEVKYPKVPGSAPPNPETAAKKLFPDYVKYVYNFALAAAGIIALGVLIAAGFRYLTSSGNPEKLKEARNQILSALLGIIILFSSFLILRSINPQLVDFGLPKLKEIIFPALPKEPPPAPPVYANWLWRITEIAASVKEIAANEKKGVKSIAQDIKTLTSECDCKNSQPMCLCQDYMKGPCEAAYCYSASETQPCPQGPEIKRKENLLIASSEELVYYKNRAGAEKKDFLLKIKNLKKEINYYQGKIGEEKKYLGKIKGRYARGEERKIIEDLEKKKQNLIKKLGLYQELEKELSNLEKQIGKITAPSKKLSELPEQCSSNVKEKCQGTCQGGGHNTTGLFPVKCQGKEKGENNPCPIDDIKAEAKRIEFLAEEISSISDKIIKITEKITSF